MYTLKNFNLNSKDYPLIMMRGFLYDGSESEFYSLYTERGRNMRKLGKFKLLTLATAIIFTLAACSGGGGGSNTGGGNTEPPANTNNQNNDNKQDNNANNTNTSDEKIELSFWTLGNVDYEDLAKEYM